MPASVTRPVRFVRTYVVDPVDGDVAEAVRLIEQAYEEASDLGDVVPGTFRFSESLAEGAFREYTCECFVERGGF